MKKVILFVSFALQSFRFASAEQAPIHEHKCQICFDPETLYDIKNKMGDVQKQNKYIFAPSLILTGASLWINAATWAQAIRQYAQRMRAVSPLRELSIDIDALEPNERLLMTTALLLAANHLCSLIVNAMNSHALDGIINKTRDEFFQCSESKESAEIFTLKSSRYSTLASNTVTQLQAVTERLFINILALLSSGISALLNQRGAAAGGLFAFALLGSLVQLWSLNESDKPESEIFDSMRWANCTRLSSIER